ncbi:MAG: hypothetical protein AB8E15_04810 [Bdellovibrionales bacterium]
MKESIFKKIIDKILHPKKDRESQDRHRIAVFSFFGLICLLVYQMEQNLISEKTSYTKKEKIKHVDTMIPKDHSLIPLDIVDSDKLDSILGQSAIVNLYADTNRGRILIVKNLRIFRAPLNPSVFGALVRDDNVASLFKYDGPFHISVKNTKTNSGTSFVKTIHKKLKSNLIVENLF